MPQMGPALWLVLYIYFIGSLFLFYLSLYSYKGVEGCDHTTSVSTPSVIWSW